MLSKFTCVHQLNMYSSFIENSFPAQFHISDFTTFFRGVGGKDILIESYNNNKLNCLYCATLCKCNNNTSTIYTWRVITRTANGQKKY